VHYLYKAPDGRLTALSLSIANGAFSLKLYDDHFKNRTMISKRMFVTCFLAFSFLFSYSQTDEESVKGQVTRLVSDWNSHKFENMDSYTTEDVEWVNIIGIWWKGRTEVKEGHQRNFNAIFKGVEFKQKSLKIRFLTSDVAIANLICHVGEFFPPDGVDHGNNKMPAADDLLTLVYIKKNGKWLLSAGQNTVIQSRPSRTTSEK
jgi:uncharacterized protein (TIGR02246 family)